MSSIRRIGSGLLAKPLARRIGVTDDTDEDMEC